jgi:hypothetical protein
MNKRWWEEDILTSVGQWLPDEGIIHPTLKKYRYLSNTSHSINQKAKANLSARPTAPHPEHLTPACHQQLPPNTTPRLKPCAELITMASTTIPVTGAIDKSKPYFPLAGLASDGWSNEDYATATCFCGAVQLAAVRFSL